MSTVVDTDTNKRIVRRWIELANAHDFERLGEVWAEDCVLHQGHDLGEVRGLPEFKELLKSFYIGLPDLKIAVDDVVGNDDIVILRTTSSGTHTGPLFGIEATGRQVTYSGIGTYRIADEKIADEWFNDDLFALMQQISSR